VNLDLIVDQIGAAVRYKYCRDAFTHFQPNGPVIYLSTATSASRKRFILAHELAHIIIRNPTAIQLIEQHGKTKLLENEEDLANRIAGALLVPDNWVEGIRRTRLSPVRLWEVARRAGIPISTLVTRIESTGIDIALLHWRRGRRSWHVVDRPGTPPFMHGYVEISALGRRALDYLGREESEIITDCRINGIWARINGRGFSPGNRDGHVFQFLAPKSDIAFLKR
jgi:IrrE N-terminal-like domain